MIKNAVNSCTLRVRMYVNVTTASSGYLRDYWPCNCTRAGRRRTKILEDFLSMVTVWQLVRRCANVCMVNVFTENREDFCLAVHFVPVMFVWISWPHMAEIPGRMLQCGSWFVCYFVFGAFVFCLVFVHVQTRFFCWILLDYIFVIVYYR